MKIMDIKDAALQEVTIEGAVKVKMCNLLSEADGVPNFAMRLFSVEPGGETPLHTHSFEHEVYVLSGEGVLHVEGSDYDFKEGYVLYVPPDIEHNFRQKGEHELRFLCLIPIE